MVHLLKNVTQEIVSCFHGKSSTWTKTEDGLIEYKSRDYLSGSNESASTNVVDDLMKKLSLNSTKLYVFGVEDNGKIEPVSESKWGSDRIDQLAKNIKIGLASRGFSNVEIDKTRILLDNGQLLLFVFRKY